MARNGAAPAGGSSVYPSNSFVADSSGMCSNATTDASAET
jgi:hypothetical protein